VNIKVHVVEFISNFFSLKFISILVKDLGEEKWNKDHKNSKSKGPSLIVDVTIDWLRIPNRELSSAGNDSLDVTDVNCSNSQVPGPFLLKTTKVSLDLRCFLWRASSANDECEHEYDNENNKESSKECEDLQIIKRWSLLCFVDNNISSSDPVHQVKVWLPHLNQLLWVEYIEFNKLDELFSVSINISWYNNSIEFQVANNLKSKEHAPEIIHSTS